MCPKPSDVDRLLFVVQFADVVGPDSDSSSSSSVGDSYSSSSSSVGDSSSSVGYSDSGSAESGSAGSSDPGSESEVDGGVENYAVVDRRFSGSQGTLHWLNCMII